MKRLSSLRKPPEWFKINTYKHLPKLDAKGWLKLLEEKSYGTAITFSGESESLAPHLKQIVSEITSGTIIQAPSSLNRHFITVRLDLRAQNSALLESIIQTIDIARDRQRFPDPGTGSGRKSKYATNIAFSPAIFDGWVSNKIIELLDLENGSSAHQEKFTNAEVANWLFGGYAKPGNKLRTAKAVLKTAIKSIPALRAHCNSNKRLP